MKKLLLFDFDGVLANSIDDILINAKIASDSIGIRTEPTKKAVGSQNKMEFDVLGELIGIPRDRLPEFVDVILGLFSGTVNIPKIFDGIPEMLFELRDNIICIVTANSENYVRNFSDHYDISKYIERIYDRYYSAGKEVKFRAAMEAHEISIDNVYVIGDASSDITAAHNVNIKSIAVSWGFQDHGLLMMSRPDFIADSPDDIIKIVSNK